MMKFRKTEEFKDLNIGLALDEGLASSTEEFSIFYSERLIWCNFFFFFVCVFLYY